MDHRTDKIIVSNRSALGEVQTDRTSTFECMNRNGRDRLDS